MTMNRYKYVGHIILNVFSDDTDNQANVCLLNAKTNTLRLHCIKARLMVRSDALEKSFAM